MKNIILLPIIILILLPTFILAQNNMEKINLSEMSLQEKIGQLIILKPNGLDKKYLDELHIGGIFLSKMKTKGEYKKTISFYQNHSKIKLFVATDMEGYWNPFEKFYKSKSFGGVNSSNEAYELGKEHGEILRELGFNLDFSPVVEVKNKVWPGRSFKGAEKQVKEKISNYIKGLHEEEILSTAKHYPGGSMVKNPHWFKYKTQISQQDLEYFNHAISKGVDAMMVGHPVVYGTIDSKGKPASVSPEVIGNLKKNFSGLIITDAVTMWGLRWFYLLKSDKLYSDLIIAGNDILLDTYPYLTYKVFKTKIKKIEEAVNKGKISEQRIDESVKRILEIKGYEVIS